MGLFDSHAHYDDERFDEVREEIIKGLRHKNDVNPLGVSFVVNSASGIESSKKAIALAEKYDFFFATAGIHPAEADTYNDKTREELISLLSHKKVVALGETGLDYHYDEPSREVQMEAFLGQMALAESLSMKVIIHERDAHQDAMSVVNKFKGRVTGVFHSFSGSFEMACELVKLGWYISYSGTVTFKNAPNVQRSVLAVPDDRLLIETDAPYLAPVPYRGQLCDSSKMYETAKKIAEIRNTTVEYIEKITSDNARRFFSLEENCL